MLKNHLQISETIFLFVMNKLQEACSLKYKCFQNHIRGKILQKYYSRNPGRQPSEYWNSKIEAIFGMSNDKAKLSLCLGQWPVEYYRTILHKYDCKRLKALLTVESLMIIFTMKYIKTPKCIAKAKIISSALRFFFKSFEKLLRKRRDKDQ